MNDETKHHIHMISDSTGETLLTAVRAVLAPFEHVPVTLHEAFLIRSDRDLDMAVSEIERHPGLVFHTLVNPAHRLEIESTCARLSSPAIPLLDPLIARVSEFFGESPRHRPGMQHRIDSDYFDRISALDFAISHDDGALGNRMMNADVILTGVSRTSKTPTCIYLAYRGVKAANMPLVPGNDPDRAFFEALDAGIPAIGLTASPNRLAQIRTNRLEALGDRTQSYADLDQIREEVSNARLFFESHDIPVIDVTRRSIEETAAEILAQLRVRKGGGA
ncbi:MAG: pyruvate, water dikinase regulatory protein [Pseudomonadota bacterium]